MADPSVFRVEERDLVGVPRRHRVRADVLDVRDEHVAVFRSADLRRVDVFDDEAEQVAVPHVDQGPDVATVKVLCSVEQSSGRLNGDRRDRMLGRQMRHNVGQRSVEDALTVEGTFELKEGTVAFVGRLLRERERLCAAHRVVAAGVAEEPRDLFHG